MLVAGVDQLLRGRRRGRQDAEPGERIDPLEDLEHAVRHARPADAVEAVAAGDEVAAHFQRGVVLPEADHGLGTLEVVQAHRVDLEVDRTAGREAGRDQVLDHLVLAVDRDLPPAGQRGEVDPMAAAGEADLEPVVDQAFAPQPGADPGLVQQVDRALLEHPGADPLLDVAPAVALQHDRVDAVPMQQLRQQQARRPGADDADLGLDHRPRSRGRAALQPSPGAILP